MQIRKGLLYGRLAYLGVCALILANCVVTVYYTAVSVDNYPGGKALTRLNEMYHSHDKVQVHICNLAAQTGASLFLQTHAPPYIGDLAPTGSLDWVYNKTEHLTPNQLTASPYLTHVIAEIADDSRQNAFQSTGFPASKWRLTAVITALKQVKNNIRSPRKLISDPLHAVQLVKSEQLAILERK